ncbi:threonylcarbamoyl-AMP synthase [bacterium]|nr:threonylcarbamoyl-AMP synthase [bacterium]
MRDNSRVISPAPPAVAAAALLRDGRLVAFPTETVYGLGADADNAAAVRKIFAVKGRPPDHPLIVHLAQSQQIAAWGREIPPLAFELARSFWPGPLTLILRRQGHVSDVVTGGLDTIGLRVPAHNLALEMLERFGGGVAAPSANRYGQVSPTTAQHVRDELGAGVDFVLDGGPCNVGIESTIVDLSGIEADGSYEPRRAPAILRPGAVTAEDLKAASGISFAWRSASSPRAPGMHAAHYAPRCRVLIATDSAELLAYARLWVNKEAVVGLLDFGNIDSLTGALLPELVQRIRLEPAPGAIAAHLYQRLRDADNSGIEVLLCMLPEERGLGVAIADRLRRAAGQGSAGSDAT